jgi:hypothetical protein
MHGRANRLGVGSIAPPRKIDAGPAATFRVERTFREINHNDRDGWLR